MSITRASDIRDRFFYGKNQADDYELHDESEDGTLVKPHKVDAMYPYGLDAPASAVEIIDRLEKIIVADQVARGSYFMDDAVNKVAKNEGAICGGHYFCAIGSAFFAAGGTMVRYLHSIEMESPEGRIVAFHPWPTTGNRHGAHRDRHESVKAFPHLREALDALNDAALSFIDSGEYERDLNRSTIETPDAIEDLFENYDVDVSDLIEVCDIARASLRGELESPVA